MGRSLHIVKKETSGVVHCLCGYNSSGDYDLLASIQDSVNERLILYIRKVYNVSINYYEEGNKGVTGKRKFKQIE